MERNISGIFFCSSLDSTSTPLSRISLFFLLAHESMNSQRTAGLTASTVSIYTRSSHSIGIFLFHSLSMLRISSYGRCDKHSRKRFFYSPAICVLLLLKNYELKIKEWNKNAPIKWANVCECRRRCRCCRRGG